MLFFFFFVFLQKNSLAAVYFGFDFKVISYPENDILVIENNVNELQLFTSNNSPVLASLCNCHFANDKLKQW